MEIIKQLFNLLPVGNFANYFILGFFAGMVGHYYRHFMQTQNLNYWKQLPGAFIKGLMGGLIGVSVNHYYQYAILSGLFVDFAYENMLKFYGRVLTNNRKDDNGTDD